MLKRILAFVVAVILVAGYMPVQAEDEQNGAALFDFDRLNLSEGKDDVTATLRTCLLSPFRRLFGKFSILPRQRKTPILRFSMNVLRFIA